MSSATTGGKEPHSAPADFRHELLSFESLKTPIEKPLHAAS